MRIFFCFLFVHDGNFPFASERNRIWHGFITGFNCKHFKSVYSELDFLNKDQSDGAFCSDIWNRMWDN